MVDVSNVNHESGTAMDKLDGLQGVNGCLAVCVDCPILSTIHAMGRIIHVDIMGCVLCCVLCVVGYGLWVVWCGGNLLHLMVLDACHVDG